MATEAHKQAVLHMGFLLGSLTNADTAASMAESIRTGQLNRKYVEMLRDRLNNLLVASDTGTPPQPVKYHDLPHDERINGKRPPANIEDDDGCPN